MIGEFISQVWPNLAANVLWVPLAWWHHRKIGKRIEEAVKKHVGVDKG